MSKTAVIIDDNDMNLETLRVLLKREGVEAITMTSPMHIEAHLSNIDEVSVVFLDLEFPQYDGFQLIGQLKALPQLAHVPFIAYTVHISEQNEIRDAGFDGFVGKPLNPKKFPGQLERILNALPVWDAGQ